MRWDAHCALKRPSTSMGLTRDQGEGAGPGAESMFSRSYGRYSGRSQRPARPTYGRRPHHRPSGGPPLPRWRAGEESRRRLSSPVSRERNGGRGPPDSPSKDARLSTGDGGWGGGAAGRLGSYAERNLPARRSSEATRTRAATRRSAPMLPPPRLKLHPPPSDGLASFISSSLRRAPRGPIAR